KGKDDFARPEAEGGPASRAGPGEKGAARLAAPTAGMAAKSATPSPDRVTITHPDKVLYPDAGITKGDVAQFYRRIAPRLLPHLRDRPVTLERFPEGVGADKPHFWQKDTPA